jgi:UDP-2-acetamido-2-deoxy-ribo-hexuluronate aminotransferase
MRPIQMVDLSAQYNRLKKEINESIVEVLETSTYINGPAVKKFQKNLEDYLSVKHVIPCANGTDALQIAMMALGLKPGDEVIVPAFTYVATAEVAALLGLNIVMTDVDPETFNIRAEDIEQAITPKTKAIVPVHLFGQSCDMDPIMMLAKKHGLYVIEDNAQAIGADYLFSDTYSKKTGTIGDIGCTSFYPSKNLGAYGDGGAIFCNDEETANQIRMIANHGQKRRYYHDVIGINSRLDSVQAALLNVKLKYLDDFNKARQKAADYYDAQLGNLKEIKIPKRSLTSTHVFHQYTIRVPAGKRDELQTFLSSKSIPTMIYYPLPLYDQSAFHNSSRKSMNNLPVSEELCKTVISLPMHSEMDIEQLQYICEALNYFFK